MEPIAIQHHPRQVRTSRIHRHQAARPISSGGRLQQSASDHGLAAGQRSSIVFFQARPPAARFSGAWPTRSEQTMASINPRLADIRITHRPRPTAAAGNPNPYPWRPVSSSSGMPCSSPSPPIVAKDPTQIRSSTTETIQDPGASKSSKSSRSSAASSNGRNIRRHHLVSNMHPIPSQLQQTISHSTLASNPSTPAPAATVRLRRIQIDPIHKTHPQSTHSSSDRPAFFDRPDAPIAWSLISTMSTILSQDPQPWAALGDDSNLTASAGPRSKSSGRSGWAPFRDKLQTMDTRNFVSIEHDEARQQPTICSYLIR